MIRVSYSEIGKQGSAADQQYLVRCYMHQFHLDLGKQVTDRNVGGNLIQGGSHSTRRGRALA